MKASKRILVVGIFGCRVLYEPLHHPSLPHHSNTLLRITPIVAVRLYYLAPDKNYVPTVTSIIPHVLAEGVLNSALIATSIPALKPFLQPLHTGSSPTVGGGGVYCHSSALQSQARGTYKLSSFAGTTKEHAQASIAEQLPDGIDTTLPTAKPQPNGDRRSSANASKVDGQHDDAESVESNNSQQMIIRATTEWTVRYEDR